MLVANRGEIAVRVLRTCRRLGVRGVAIYTDPDAAAPHVRSADAAIRVHSYLDIAGVVTAAHRAGVEAIHPGYGFLSERAAFAAAVAESGLVMVGPSATVMERMGRKDAARAIAVAAGVPVVPSYALDDAPDRMTFPVLVKAAAGGGGRGMRIVRSPADLPEALAAARREAVGAFGDDTLLIESYVERGRHIEVQILADAHGHVLALHERDCSVQRRHQKVIEEAPAPTLDAGTRAAIVTAAVDLAREVGYVNAGTVEFLLDADTGAFYFLEMNTRLQVEHPVTEAICGGLDLVELQLQVAAGEHLALDPADLGPYGHAIEARVYAEDARAGFLPQAGTAHLVRWPEGPGVRVDHALESGQVVTTAYDPMLGKVIVHAGDRETARRRLVEALDRTAILGLTTNVGFLRELVAGREFAEASVEVSWLDRRPVPTRTTGKARAIAAWAAADQERCRAASGPFRSDGWRLGADPAPVMIELDEVLKVDPVTGRVAGAGGEWQIQPAGEGRLLVDGAGVWAARWVSSHAVEVALRGERFRFARPDILDDHQPATGDGLVVAPMPSLVVDIRVEVGDRVVADQVLGTLEAMKMELALRAPFAGTVREVVARAGQRVDLGAPLVSLEPLEEPE